MNWGYMLFALLLPFIAALLFILPLDRWNHKVFSTNLLSRLAVIIPASLFIYFILQKPEAIVGISPDATWNEYIPFNLRLNLDGLGWLFSLLITGIGTLIFLYAGGYMKTYRHRLRLMGFLSLFMGAMLGVVLVDNLMSLFLFWELTSISSFFLIGFNNEEEASRRSALKALAVTGGGGLIMLAGFILLGEAAGTYNISEMIAISAVIKEHELFPAILVLVLLGAFTKSAQFPFHFWLPGAMKAPTPVSAYLHSATMVKAGVYLLARFTPVLGDHPYWNNTLMIVGGVTMVYAAFHAILRTDMKAILAYSTVSALGILVFLLGIGTKASLLAASIFILIHALYKASLFLVTGIVDQKTKSRDISTLSGLRKVMWPVALAGVLAAVSNAGIPPTLGFVGKDLIYEGTLGSGDWSMWLTVFAVGTNILLLVAGFMAGWKPFAGALPQTLEKVKMPEWTMWVPPLLLALLGLIFGLAPFLIESSLVNEVFLSISGGSMEGHLALWHGFNTVLYLSMTTIGVGILLYFVNRPGGPISIWIMGLEKLSPEYLWTAFAGGINKFASIYTRVLQNGYLRYYLMTILTTLILLLGWKLMANGRFYMDIQSLSQITIYEALAVLVLLAALAMAVVSRSRLAAVASMGVVGYAICIIFVFYSAPDLAMTQFTIDTLTVILFVLILYKLPKFLPLKFTSYHIRDILVSLGVGVVITLLALEVLQTVPSREITDFYAANAYVLAKGKNIVNVILVDFRGSDTLIEIAVLCIAAIGVFSLLKLRIKDGQRIE